MSLAMATKFNLDAAAATHRTNGQWLAEVPAKSLRDLDAPTDTTLTRGWRAALCACFRHGSDRGCKQGVAVLIRVERADILDGHRLTGRNSTPTFGLRDGVSLAADIAREPTLPEDRLAAILAPTPVQMLANASGRTPNLVHVSAAAEKISVMRLPGGNSTKVEDEQNTSFNGLCSLQATLFLVQRNQTNAKHATPT